MRKISTVQTFGKEILNEQKLTIGVDLGDRWSFYCVLDEAGKIILEQKVATTPEAMKQIFEKIPRGLETGRRIFWKFIAIAAVELAVRRRSLVDSM